jgi:hypothetical protein
MDIFVAPVLATALLDGTGHCVTAKQSVQMIVQARELATAVPVPVIPVGQVRPIVLVKRLWEVVLTVTERMIVSLVIVFVNRDGQGL